MNNLPKCLNPNCTNLVKTKKNKYCSCKCMGASKDVLNKRIQTCKKIYGTSNASESQLIKQRIKNTKLEKYGDEDYNNEDKKIETCISKYGVKNVRSLESVKKKIDDSHIAKYGVRRFMQTSDGIKVNYQHKPYTLPSGKIISVMGYEPQAIELLLQTYKEDDLVLGSELANDLKIYYIKDNQQHRYFPDIYIKSTNTIIEVKSTYTMEANKEVNLLKEEACKSAGFNFEFMIL